MLFGRAPPRLQRLLIVEDEPLVAFDNEHFLETHGYIVVATIDNAPAVLAAIDAVAAMIEGKKPGRVPRALTLYG
jgi:hypothetical protein